MWNFTKNSTPEMGIRTRFARAEQGNFAMMTAVAMAGMMIAIGAGMDYTRAAQRSNELQNFADAAVLAGASSRGKTDAEVKQRVLDVMSSYNDQGWNLDVEVVVDADRIVLNVATDSSSLFGSFMGRDKTPVAVTTASPRAQLVPIQMAVVLDTTGSMKGDNLVAMQAAANELVDALEDLDADVEASIVPFGQYVNIGVSEGKPGTRNWIDMMNYGEEYQHCWTPKEEVEAQSCVTGGEESYTYTDDGREFTGTRTKKTCTGGQWNDLPEQCETRTRGWNGCMGSRNNGHAKKASYNGKRLPAAIDEWCGSELLALSSNYTEMRSTINGLTTRGSTYLPSGLVWGWRTLDPNLPYPEAKNNKSPRLKRAMLFMTDGQNNLSVGDAYNDKKGVKHRNKENSGEKGLEMTEDLCAEINSDDIELFVVAYQMPGETETAEVLQDCATSSFHFFTPDTATQLKETFADIAAALDSTRLEF